MTTLLLAVQSLCCWQVAIVTTLSLSSHHVVTSLSDWWNGSFVMIPELTLYIITCLFILTWSHIPCQYSLSFIWCVKSTSPISVATMSRKAACFHVQVIGGLQIDSESLREMTEIKLSGIKLLTAYWKFSPPALGVDSECQMSSTLLKPNSLPFSS